MPQPRVLILRAPGTNCDQETAHAFELAGGRPERHHVNRLLDEPKLLADFQILCLPGGFSYGDDIGAGRILGSQIEHRLAEHFAQFKEAGKLILGICNGFQILMKSGILLPVADAGPPATLTWNDSGRFEARWVELRTTGSHCVFFAGIDRIDLPIAHAEGKFVARDEPFLAGLEKAGQVTLRYQAAGGDARGAYPANPNGSLSDVAGICDATGRVAGLMPHPERFVDATQHPQWTRREQRGAGDGLRVFENAVRYFR
ncbi:MAG TPA: phosphoribosylformylglycinamidine synthase I [Pirellulales bacterium]|nr:phosphoribosylformylglycinamidine synthase I [Pirellulales bacterium]